MAVDHEYKEVSKRDQVISSAFDLKVKSILAREYEIASEAVCGGLLNVISQLVYVLFGESDKKCGHGKNWQALMVQYGLNPDPFHNMEITR